MVVVVVVVVLKVDGPIKVLMVTEVMVEVVLVKNVTVVLVIAVVVVKTVENMVALVRAGSSTVLRTVKVRDKVEVIKEVELMVRVVTVVRV